MIDKAAAYLTPEDIEIALKNGIREDLVKRRFYFYGWTKEKAINHPYKNLSENQAMIDLAKSNGIRWRTYYHRITKGGWDPLKAATTKLSKRGIPHE